MLLFIWIVTKFVFYLFLSFLVYLGLVYLVINKRRRAAKKLDPNTKVISFLHPFCNDCGGGEKVLWMMVQALKELKAKNPKTNFRIKILAGIKEEAQTIMSNLKARFEINLEENQNVDIEIVRLKKSNLLKPQKFLTMFLQIFGQVVFAFEALTKVHSDVLIDTTGLPFTYWIFSLFGGSSVVAYVHYPFISDDMISDIQSGVEGVHSRGVFGKFKIFKKLKVFYYRIIMALYRWNGSFVEFQMSNSSWTYNHMKKIWPHVKREKLYPPCSTALYETKTVPQERRNLLVSFAQFRPEKRHKMQVNIFTKVRQLIGEKELRFEIIGSIRDETDKKLYNDLQEYINQQGLSEFITLRPNLTLRDVKSIFATAKIGLHTMRDEHFGISIIEMMASGLVTIAHNSAGPKHDIIGVAKEFVGVLAEGINYIILR